MKLIVPYFSADDILSSLLIAVAMLCVIGYSIFMMRLMVGGSFRVGNADRILRPGRLSGDELRKCEDLIANRVSLLSDELQAYEKRILDGLVRKLPDDDRKEDSVNQLKYQNACRLADKKEERSNAKHPRTRSQYLHSLGLSESPAPSRTDIRDAYRRLAKEHHPDGGGSSARFTEIVTAYRALKSG